jgi:hypothetical protein
MLKIGTKVNWRGAWGKQPAKEATVTGITIGCVGKVGHNVPNVHWELVNDRSVIVDLDNGHWAYGNQISKVNETPFWATSQYNLN